jgi:hypothetical protein
MLGTTLLAARADFLAHGPPARRCADASVVMTSWPSRCRNLAHEAELQAEWHTSRRGLSETDGSVSSKDDPAAKFK